MAESAIQFYECDNPGCQLRFPGSENQPRWQRCPLCRSSIHPVAASTRFAENKPAPGVEAQQTWQVEAILDNIRSAWNVGSIFRTADGTGIRRLYLCGITPTPDNSKVNKTALGAEVAVPWEKRNNGVVLAAQLRSAGYRLWALEDIPGAQPLFQVNVEWNSSPIALIVGNEVSGIDPGILGLCDTIISIPMLGKKQSYNVAVAFGIAASFLLYRQSASQGSFNILPNT